MAYLSPPILPFFDVYTVFVMLILGFLFLEIVYNLGQDFKNNRNDEEKGFFGRATDIEKLLWFTVFGFVIYLIPVIGITPVMNAVFYSAPKSAIILSNLHTPLFHEFLQLQSVWNLAGTQEGFFASSILDTTFWIFAFIFAIFILSLYGFFKTEKLKITVGNALTLYSGLSLYIVLILVANSTHYFIYLVLSGAIFFICLILYMEGYIGTVLKNLRALIEKFVSKHKRAGIIVKFFINAFTNRFMWLYLITSVLISATFLSSRYIGSIVPNLIYFIFIGLSSVMIFGLGSLINKADTKFHEILYVALIIIIVIVTESSLGGFQRILPSEHVTIQNVIITNFLYNVNGYIMQNTSKTAITNNGTFQILGNLTIPKGLNYTYLTILNASSQIFPILYASRQPNSYLIKTEIENETLPPGHFVGCNGLTYCCYTNSSNISCYPYQIENNSYLIVNGKNLSSGAQLVHISLLYSLALNSTISNEELNYSYLKSNSCNLSSCKLNIIFRPLFGSTVSLNYVQVYLPNSYSNITLSVENQTCQNYHSIIRSTDSCFKSPIGDTGEITYSGTSTNYVYLDWIIYNGTALNLNLTMTNS